MEPDARPIWQTKLFWDAVIGCLGVVGTTWAFAFDAHPIAKAVFATITGIAVVLAPLFIGDRVTRVSGGKSNGGHTQLGLLCLVVVIALVILLPGCVVPSETRGIVRRQFILQREFAARAAAGQATEAQLRQNTLVNAECWRQLDRILSGATELNAEPVEPDG